MLSKKFIGGFLVTLLTPTIARADGLSQLAAKTFVSGPGSVIVGMVLISIVSWIGQSLVKATNKTQWAAFIDTATTLTFLSMVIGVALLVLHKFLSVAGLI
jgi:hypothetical protein